MTAKGRLDRREMVLLRGLDREGRTGLGEAVPLSLRGGASVSRVASELEAWGRATVAGEPLPGGMSAPAACAAETLRHDLAAQRAGLPLHAYLRRGSGGFDRGAPDVAGPDSVVCNATLTTGPPEAVAEQALAWAERGFATFKLKVGSGEDVAQVEAVRAALGPDARIRVDANGSWSVPEAAEILGRMAELGLELAEQPVEGLERMVELAAATSVRLVADESVASRREAARAAALGACAGATVKLSKIGGLDVTLGGHLPTYLSSALDGPVGIAAAAHAALAMPEAGPFAGLAHGLATQSLFSETIASSECSLEGDRLSPPPGPGLGVALDEAALQAHRIG